MAPSTMERISLAFRMVLSGGRRRWSARSLPEERRFSGCAARSRRQVHCLLVQNEQTRRLEQCTSEGDSGADHHWHGTTVADHGVDAVLKFLNKVPGSGHLESVFELGIGCFLVVDDVVSYGAVEQEGSDSRNQWPREANGG